MEGVVGLNDAQGPFLPLGAAHFYVKNYKSLHNIHYETFYIQV